MCFLLSAYAKTLYSVRSKLPFEVQAFRAIVNQTNGTVKAINASTKLKAHFNKI